MQILPCCFQNIFLIERLLRDCSSDQNNRHQNNRNIQVTGLILVWYSGLNNRLIGPVFKWHLVWGWQDKTLKNVHTKKVINPS